MFARVSRCIYGDADRFASLRPFHRLPFGLAGGSVSMLCVFPSTPRTSSPRCPISGRKDTSGRRSTSCSPATSGPPSRWRRSCRRPLGSRTTGVRVPCRRSRLLTRGVHGACRRTRGGQHRFPRETPDRRDARVLRAVRRDAAHFRQSRILRYTIPRKVQSYLAAGKPVSRTPVGDAAGVMDEAGCGLRCDAEDAAALAGMCGEFAGSPEGAREGFGAAGRALYEEHFTKKSSSTRSKGNCGN